MLSPWETLHTTAYLQDCEAGFFFPSQGARPFTLRKVSFFLLLFRAKRAILSGAKDTYCSYLVKLEQTRKIVTTYNTALIHFSCWKNVIIWFQ